MFYPVRNNTTPFVAWVVCWIQFQRGFKYPAGISNGIYVLGTMEILEKLLGSNYRAKIMRFFLMNPGEVFTLEQVSKSSKVLKSRLKKEINLLMSAGFIKKGIHETHIIIKKQKKIKKRKEPGFVLNALFPYVREFRALVVDAAPVSRELIIKRFKRLGRGLKLALLSGVFVGKAEVNVPDILVVGDNLKKGPVEKILGSIESEIGKELNYVLMSTEEFKYRRGMYDRFILDILESDHDALVDTLGS
ncbi:hypothetical protein A2Z53_02590 [Candidatus Giovannonibacteria bacterium RIFCSPHIGHO2_02_42_15]|uniref:Transcriptional regulator n=2 Tax=Candidatus Giovannoniibacteriota TaxID=1752738 RepID=A0A1F5VMI2_9BACT|nr:MAG: hypothetical protein A2Z53_02590 [Candidatus Giovannonibacteria bacterium RIFCSPHIGHO2_02_42_15]